MLIHQLLDSRGLGGIESHVLTLCAALNRAGHPAECLFLADHGPHPLQPSLAESGIASGHAGGTLGLLRRLRQHPPDLLHTHGYKAGIIGRILARLAGVPVVSSFHAGEPGQGRMRFYTWLDRLTARLAPRLAVSSAIAATLPGPVTVLPNFVQPPAQLPPRPSRRPVIGFVGRLSIEKGPDLFLDLVAGLKGSCDAVIFGDGPMAATLRNHPVANQVRWAGAVAGMGPHWHEIDLLCVPSRHEGLPMAVLEAMAHGCPVAGFAVGALDQVIRSETNGYLVTPGALADLVRTVERWLLLPHDRRHTLAHAARTTILEQFSPAAGLARLLPIYQQAVSSKIQVQSSGA